MSILQHLPGDKKQACSVGLLMVVNGRSLSTEPLLKLKKELETALQEQYRDLPRKELKGLHPMDVYVAYYKKFGYTYHVLGQLESVIRGKGIPTGLPLVQAMFMAELKNLLLTAVHDLEKVEGTLKLQQATGEERYTTLSGREVATVPGDVMIADQEAVISSILRGPDRRTCIDEKSCGAVYTVYAPPGIEESAIHRHLNDLETYIHAFAPEAGTQSKQVWMHATGF
jgi:DNA/RNA-binding domain of Phe-tRNA-synthetase-like protein